MTFLSMTYRSIRKVKFLFTALVNHLLLPVYLKANNIVYGSNLRSNGLPMLDIWQKGKMSIGKNFKMNNGKNFNKIGRQQQCIFVVSDHAELQIGDNAGISSTAIICHHKITLGNNIKIGGNVCIYDTDFHSLNCIHRRVSGLDSLHTVTKPVSIGDDVFIGAHSTILKGVSIGDRAIIGACSVVVKNIPKDELWAGNPATFIRKLN